MVFELHSDKCVQFSCLFFHNQLYVENTEVCEQYLPHRRIPLNIIVSRKKTTATIISTWYIDHTGRHNAADWFFWDFTSGPPAGICQKASAIEDNAYTKIAFILLY